MRALLDEHLSAAIAELLRSRGLDVVAVSEREDIVAASDEHVMEVAPAEGRAIVTGNVKDLRPIAASRIADGRGHGGLILVPARRGRSRAATGALADAVEAVLRAHPTGIADGEHWLPPPG